MFLIDQINYLYVLLRSLGHIQNIGKMVLVQHCITMTFKTKYIMIFRFGIDGGEIYENY